MSARFALDKSNAKWLGVCAGISEATNVDVMLVRLATMLLTFFAFGPVLLVAYVLIAWIANDRTV